jgi:hypothetical protein
MHNQQFSAICRDMDHLIGDLDPAELQQRVIAQPFVVVTGDVYDVRPLPDFPKDLLDDVVVDLRPVPRLSEAPAVDDVTDQVDRIGVVVAQKIEENWLYSRACPSARPKSRLCGTGAAL